MSGVRVALCGSLLVVVTLVSWTVMMLALPLAALLSRAAVWRVTMMHLWARAVVRVLGMRVTVEGPVPEGACLLVSNHLSYVDVVLLASRMRCRFLSRADVRDWPVIGFLSATVGTLFVHRERRRDVVRVAEELSAALEQGTAVVFFPEGTSTGGARVLPFRSSLLEPAAALELPVRHATLRYETPPGAPPAHEVVAWWGDMEFVPHVRDLLRLPGFEARIVFGREPVRGTDRKRLAQRLHDEVASRLVPMHVEHPEMSAERNAARQLLVVLDQGRRLVESLENEDYVRSPEPLATSSVGAHVRHVLDCCACLVDGLPGRDIDYDRRERQVALEVDPAAAVRRFAELEAGYAGLETDWSEPLRVRSDVPEDAAPEEVWRRSTLGRELLHVLSHTIHHYALIAILLRSFGIEPEADFGVAPSTLRYWEETGRCAPLAG